MASMGIPQTGNKNKFSNIGMKPSENRGELLNKLAGRTDKSRFVDADSHNKMGKDGFLKLLANQLANQDPTNPVDQKKFAADLAQFSQLEQLTNLNKKFDSLNNNDGMEKKFFAASFLGKEVTTKGTTVNLKEDGDDSSIPFMLEKDARKVNVRIFDKSNNLIGEINKEGMGAGSHRVEWDGIALDNTPARRGEYRVEIRGWDQEMNAFRGETRSAGIVTGVSFKNGETVLKLDGKKSVTLRDVENFRIPVHNNKVKIPTINKNNVVKKYFDNMGAM